VNTVPSNKRSTSVDRSVRKRRRCSPPVLTMFDQFESGPPSLYWSDHDLSSSIESLPEYDHQSVEH
jgi:hypothetical protein